jgi:hypothetical protein
MLGNMHARGRAKIQLTRDTANIFTHPYWRAYWRDWIGALIGAIGAIGAELSSGTN